MTDIHRLRSYMTTLVMKEIDVKLDRSKFHRPSRAQVCSGMAKMLKQRKRRFDGLFHRASSTKMRKAK